MKPLIGLTCQYDYSNKGKSNKINYTYIDAIKRAGAIPIILPLVTELDLIDGYINLLQGLVLTGGEDASPILYGEEPLREVDKICFHRDKMEVELIRRAYEKRLPLLGICRGMQMINVALGGSLYQDIYRQIPDALGHISGFAIGGGYHTIELVRDSILYEIFEKGRKQVNSQHHQSVKELGENLKINARSLDGIIEGIESIDDRFILGLQFHPEAMLDEYDEFIDLFKYFVSSCKE